MCVSFVFVWVSNALLYNALSMRKKTPYPRKETDTQTYLSQYFATVPAGEVIIRSVITSPPTHSVWASIDLLVGVCRRMSSSVTLTSMTSRRLQSNYSSTVTLQGGPVVLRPVKATYYFTPDTGRHRTVEV